jgi:hypothetical protein
MPGVRGSGICQHQRVRRTCKECGRAGIREHPGCKECGGAGICEHQGVESKCKECGDLGVQRADARRAARRPTSRCRPAWRSSGKMLMALVEMDNRCTHNSRSLRGSRDGGQWRRLKN